MAAFYIDGIPQPDPFQHSSSLPAQLAEACIAYEAERVARARAATIRIEKEFGAKCDREARASVDALIEVRARQYRDQPRYLDKHFPAMDLRFADARTFLARVDAMLEQHSRGALPRWYGFGGESIEISLRAARLCGEWMLAAEQQAVAS